MSVSVCPLIRPAQFLYDSSLCTKTDSMLRTKADADGGRKSYPRVQYKY